MSYSVSGTDITLTRGDTLKVKISLTKDEEPYIPVEGDRIRFALKHNKMLKDKSDYEDPTPLVEKDVSIDTMTLVLDPGDTKHLAFDTYVYDLQMTFADGSVDTFVTQGKFKLTPEVS